MPSRSRLSTHCDSGCTRHFLGSVAQVLALGRIGIFDEVIEQALRKYLRRGFNLNTVVIDAQKLDFNELRQEPINGVSTNEKARSLFHEMVRLPKLGEWTVPQRWD